MESLEAAYGFRNPTAYAPLLADDFRFYLHEAALPAGAPQFWTRLEDSTGTSRLLTETTVKDIRISLTYDVDRPVTEIGRERWRRIRVTDTFLEVERQPAGGGEVLTLRVDGDVQDFYFRKGRTPTDTLATSPTSKLWHLVEWRDLGRIDFGSGVPAGAPLSDPASWTRLKTLFR